MPSARLEVTDTSTFAHEHQGGGKVDAVVPDNNTGTVIQQRFIERSEASAFSPLAMPSERSVFRQKRNVEKKTAMPLSSSTSRSGQSVATHHRNSGNLRDLDLKPRPMPSRDYRKIAYLTDASVSNRMVNFDAASILSATSMLSLLQEHNEISPIASSVDGSEGNSRSGSASGVESIASSKTQGSIHWAYREEDGKITATPNLNRKRSTTNGTLPTTSPMVRFRAAKQMFANPSEKVIPTKRTPPKKFFNRTPRKTAVASRQAQRECNFTGGCCDHRRSCACRCWRFRCK